MSDISSLVSTQWLTENIGDPTVRVLDGSWHLPNSDRNAKSEYEKSHIPSALFFDVDEIADLDIPLPHMMPNNEKMSSRVRAMGISNADHIVIYDNSDFNTAARAWFMFKSFGHANVSILDGGFQKWNAENKTTENKIQSYFTSHYTANKNKARIRSREDVLSNIDSQSEQLVDARSNGRFMGTAPEPRPESRGGRIPGSLNVPFNTLINKDGTYKNLDELKSI
ncbi:MAG: rhodanese-like domain-containing protein, partial [Emcibacteraceae bacterium]|nr:rhodanese-like domain-containing protein [Emcibacteraceae bacterium]